MAGQIDDMDPTVVHQIGRQISPDAAVHRPSVQHHDIGSAAAIALMIDMQAQRRLHLLQPAQRAGEAGDIVFTVSGGQRDA